MKVVPVRRAVSVGIALLLTFAGLARGGTGTLLALPVGPKPTVRGLKISLDTRWVHGYGYRPVRIEVTSVPPAVADRSLSVEFGLSAWEPDKEFVTVAAEIEIPAGSKTVSRTLAVPQLNSAQHFSFRVWEDGLLLEDLSAKGLSIVASGSYGWVDQESRILFVTSTHVDVSEFDIVDQYSGNNTPSSRAADVSSFAERAAADLPENWLNYTGLDLVFISLAEARDLAAKRPGVWQALSRWTRSGGNLCVFGAGSDWHGLEEIERLLNCPAAENEAGQQHRGWEVPSTLVFDREVVPAEVAAQTKEAVDPNAPNTTAVPKAPVAPKIAPFVLKPAGFGRVVAIAKAQPFPGESAIWRWLVQSLGWTRTDWSMRQGTAPDQDNEGFNDFLIADVGLPPIRSYRVLITLFVVAIGPVNYWILKRYGRLHLFLFTVPAAALVTTAALLTYALVADGLASRMRARSITQLDQSTGEAVRLARLSYYMGLAPSDGLTFPDDTAVAPLLLSAADGPFRGRNRRLVWRDGQHLTRGWIRSRMPTQYFTTRADKTNQQLVVKPIDDAGRTTIKNQLGVPIHQLLLCDESGKLHHGKQIAGDATAKLESLDDSNQLAPALVEFSEALAKNRPALPEGMIGSSSHSTWFISFGGPSFGYNQGTADTSDSLLEVELARIATDVASRGLKPRSYVAIVERPEQIAVGTDGLTESQSLHVIEGTW